MSNIVLVGIIEEDLKEIGLMLSERLGFFYLNCEELIDYSLVDKIKMEKLCGIEYLNSEEKKVVLGINYYERTVVSVTSQTFLNNFNVISSSNTIIYLRLTKLKLEKRLNSIAKSGIEIKNLHNYELAQIVFNERDKFIKNNCDLVLKYDISKLNELISEIENLILELK